jgi:uncharacterized protein (DUF952 family)
MPDYILHLVSAAHFNTLPNSQPYQPETFAADGFIHCTREPEVLLDIANRFFKNEPGEFLILVIDVARLTAKVKWEPPVHPGGGEAGPDEVARLFPHIYGPLNREAIVGIQVAARLTDGTFKQFM